MGNSQNTPFQSENNQSQKAQNLVYKRLNINKITQFQKLFDQQITPQKKHHHSFINVLGSKNNQNTKKQIKSNKKRPKKKQQEQILIRIEKALTFFTSLKMLQNYNKKYNKQFPTIISNKNKQVMKLRKQVKIFKQKHKHFNKQSKIIQNQQQICSIDKMYKQQNSTKHYEQFLILQRVQKIILKLYESGRHQNVLKYLHQLDRQISSNQIKKQQQNQLFSQKFTQFLQSIESCNIQLMDMLFHHSKKQQKNNVQQCLLQNNKNKKIVKKICSQNLIDIKQLIINSKQQNTEENVSYYEECKQIGFNKYKQNKVCFYLILGNNNHFFNHYHQKQQNQSKISRQNQQKSTNKSNYQHKIKELTPLNLPQKMTLFQIILQKYDAFAQLLQLQRLTIFILVNKYKIKALNYLIDNKKDKWARLNIIILRQTELPCLNKQGNFLLTQKNQQIQQIQQNFNNSASKLEQKFKNNRTKQFQQKQQKQSKLTIKTFPNGPGDLWDFLSDPLNDWGIQYLQKQNYEFIEAISLNNVLQKGFDCFMLGVANILQLDWGVKSVEQNKIKIKKQEQNQKMNKNIQRHKKSAKNDINFQMDYTYQEGLFFDIIDQQITEKNNLSQKNLLQYTNHCLIKTSYLKKCLYNNQNWKKTVKFHKKQVNLRKQLNNQILMYWTKNFSDIFITDQFNLQSQRDQKKQNYQQNDQNQVFKHPQNSYRSSGQKFKPFSNKFSTKFMIFKCEQSDEYYPLNYYQNDGIYDIQGCSKALSRQYLSLLDLKIQNFMHLNCLKQANNNEIRKFIQKFKQNSLKCYIDPHVSLSGQNLQEIRQEIIIKINNLFTDLNQDQNQEQYQRKQIMKTNKINKKVKWYDNNNQNLIIKNNIQSILIQYQINTNYYHHQINQFNQPIIKIIMN